MSSASSPGVEKIQCCHLSQWQICNLNPSTGANTEVVVKKSIESAMTRQHLRGTVQLNDPTEKRTKPDIYIEACGRHLSFDVRHGTSTQARAGRIYESREFYEYVRGESSLTTFLKDTHRFLFLAFELAIIDSTGDRQRRLFCVPGLWLQDQFDHRTGVMIDEVAEAWPSYGKNQSLLYDIDTYPGVA